MRLHFVCETIHSTVFMTIYTLQFLVVILGLDTSVLKHWCNVIFTLQLSTELFLLLNRHWTVGAEAQICHESLASLATPKSNKIPIYPAWMPGELGTCCSGHNPSSLLGAV